MPSESARRVSIDRCPLGRRGPRRNTTGAQHSNDHVAAPSGACDNEAEQRRTGDRPPAMTRRSRISLLVAIGALMLSAGSRPAGAAEITLMCPPPMRSVIVELVTGFERASGHH